VVGVPLGVQQSIVTDLRAIPREVRRDVGPAIRKAAAPVLTQARSNASWSHRIPAATTLKVLYGQKRSGVILSTSAKRAPHARPYEGLLGRTFRHPLFGDREHWYTQAARPFDWPAVQANREAVGRAVAEVVDDAARRHGFS
jgi:hypothetical protein